MTQTPFSNCCLHFMRRCKRIKYRKLGLVFYREWRVLSMGNFFKAKAFALFIRHLLVFTGSLSFVWKQLNLLLCVVFFHVIYGCIYNTLRSQPQIIVLIQSDYKGQKVIEREIALEKESYRERLQFQTLILKNQNRFRIDQV